MFVLRICELGTKALICIEKFLGCITVQKPLIRSDFPPVPEEQMVCMKGVRQGVLQII